MFSLKSLTTAAFISAATVVNAAPFERVFEPEGPGALERSTGQFVSLLEFDGTLFAVGLYSQVTNDGTGNVTANSTMVASMDGGNSWPDRLEQEGAETLYAGTVGENGVIGVGTNIVPGAITFPGISLTVDAEGEPTLSEFTLEGNSNLRGLSVAYGNGVYVYGSTFGTLLNSTNGIDWNEVDWPGAENVGGDVSQVIWDGSQFVALQGTFIFTSPDGTIWTQVTTNLGFTGLTEIAYSGDIYVGGGAVGGLQEGFLMYSTDLETWTEVTDTIAQPVTAIAYGGGYFVAVTGEFGGSALVYYSEDGMSWTELDADLGDISLSAVGFLENDWFIAGQANNSFFNPGIWKATDEFPPQGDSPEPEPTANPWAGSFEAGTNVYYDPNLGVVFCDVEASLWTYSQVLGWMYPATDYDPDLWLYIVDLDNWMYTTKTFAGLTFRVDTGLWYFYDLDTNFFYPIQ